MTSLSWFRHYSDAHTNFKLRRLPEPTQLFYWWIVELHAKAAYDPGDTAAIAEALFVAEDRVRDEITALKAGNLLRKDGSIKGWDDRNPVSDHSSDRVKKHRAATKLGRVTSTPVTVTSTPVTVTDETPSEIESESELDAEVEREGGRARARARGAERPAPPAPAGVPVPGFPPGLGPSDLGPDYWPPIDTLTGPTGRQLAYLHVLASEASAARGVRVTVADAADGLTLTGTTVTMIADRLKAMRRVRSPVASPGEIAAKAVELYEEWEAKEAERESAR